MATRKTHDLAVKVGSYTDKQTGQEKGRYQNVGAVMEGDNGSFIMLAKWFNPAGVTDSRGGESVLLSMFEPKQDGQAPRQAAPAQKSAPSKGFDDMDSDIPF
jgi:hypothetical protein